MNLKTSTSDSTQQSRKKRSNLKSQSLKSWRDLERLTNFLPVRIPFPNPFLKNSPLSLENKKNVHDNHFACRNFCSAKVFCALMASGTPGKGLEAFLLGNMAHLSPIPFSIAGRCLSPMVLDLEGLVSSFFHLDLEAC